ncbi:MAG: M20/M25/M40 family metallo-hydrolase [Bryobacteraceae bacterium]
MRFAALFLAAILCAQGKVDLSVVHKIKNEAFENSKAMDTLGWLTDVNGPRLTGSPEYTQAAEWTKKRLEEYGLTNVHFEKWGPFGRAWSAKEYSVEVLEPRYSRVIAMPLAWTDSTPGPVTGEVFFAPLGKGQPGFNPTQLAKDIEQFKKDYAGKLRAKIVLISNPITLTPPTQSVFRRYTAAELAAIEQAPTPVEKLKIDPKHLEVPEDPAKLGQFFQSLSEEQVDELLDQVYTQRGELAKFLKAEGALGALMADGRAHGGMVFAEQAGPQKASYGLALPTFVLTAEQYNRLCRLVEKKQTVRVRANLQVEASAGDVDGFNILGEIKGTTKPDEIVMIGAHFDSWHSGTGATDNGAGSTVMIEVMRILKSLNLKMDRTVRIALWSGEEQGLYGSRNYVKEHFGVPHKPTTQHGKLSGYFNLDNGSGKIRGVYLQGHDEMRPIFEAWLAPFHDLGATAISIRDTGGTDHLSFNSVGLPGFQFIQDPLDYSTVTHHSSMDVYDHVISGDLMQASAIVASMVYNTATRPAMLPRKAE